VGTVSASAGTTLTLKPSNSATTFTVTTTVTAEGRGTIASLTGTVTLESGKTQQVTISTGGGGGGGGGGRSSSSGGSNTGGSKTQIGDTDEDEIPVYTGDFSFPLPSVAAAKAYLAHLAENNDPRGGVDAPVLLPMKMNLGSRADSLAKFLAVIAAAGKYVEVDLALCSMTGTVFDPDREFSTGKDRVVSLILPDAAESIKPGISHNMDIEPDPQILDSSTFQYFVSLKRVSGRSIKTIGSYVFGTYSTGTDAVDLRRQTLSSVDFPAVTSVDKFAFISCSGLTTAKLPALISIGLNAFTLTGLTTVDFPAAISIGPYAFSDCYALSSVYFPRATSIGNAAFAWCHALTAVDFPAITSIDANTFMDCNALTEVNLPAATSIGNAFADCIALTTINLPSAISIGDSAFASCANLTTVNLPAVTSIGAPAFYDTGTGDLSITLPAVAPVIIISEPKGGRSPINAIGAKTVTIRRPANNTGYDNTWQANFKFPMFCSYLLNDVNISTITLKFEDL
jgi:hypothetical protein